MTTTKTLMIAAVAALSLGAGAVKAQSLTPSSAEGTYYAEQNRAAHANGQPQSGSPNMDQTLSSSSHGATVHSNVHLFGVGGAGG